MKMEISKLIDRKVIGTRIYTENYENYITYRMKRSPYLVKIPRIINSDISYLIGFVMGDGNITLIDRKISAFPRTKINIYNSSMSLLSRVNLTFKENFNISGKLWKKKDKNCYVLTFNNKILWSFFVNVIGLKPKKKKYLEVVRCVKKEDLFRYFLAGLMDTDGFFTSRTFGIMMNGTNEKFLREISYLSDKFYDIKFLKPVLSDIIVDGKTYNRVQINLSRHSVRDFVQQIPLKNEKWAGQDFHLK